SFAITSIPALWGLGFAAHLAAVTIKIGWGVWDNADARKNPSELKISTSQALFLRRLQAINANTNEVLALWAAAVLYAVQKGANPAELDSQAMSFLALRVAFAGVYLWADTQAKSLLRTVVWLAGVAIPVSFFFKY
ncbi:hypothetical protein HDU93_001541, partial [Gonapodya sp. JEL0774]